MLAAPLTSYASLMTSLMPLPRLYSGRDLFVLEGTPEATSQSDSGFILAPADERVLMLRTSNGVHPGADSADDLPIRDLTPSGLPSLWLLTDDCAYEDHALGIAAMACLLGEVQAAQHLVSLPRNKCLPARTGCPTRSSFFSGRNRAIFSCKESKS